MTAEEFIERKTRAVYSSDVYELAEEYASHVLQEYKKGLAEKIKTQPVVYAVDLIPHLTKLKEDE